MPIISNTTAYGGNITISNGNANTWYIPSHPQPLKETTTEVKRDDFEFPYTGDQIADRLEARAVEAEAAADKVDTLITEEVVEILYSYDRDDAKARFRDKALVHRNRAADLRKEAIPFKQAGKKEFTLDLDDVKHYGLDSGG